MGICVSADARAARAAQDVAENRFAGARRSISATRQAFVAEINARRTSFLRPHASMPGVCIFLGSCAIMLGIIY